MKILATGFNPADCNALKRQPRVQIFQAFPEVLDVLSYEGEDITWQRMLVGQDIPKGTEVVIVSMLLPRSLNSPYALGAMWTIIEAIRLDIPLILYMTDWAFYAAWTEYRSIHKAGADYFYKTIGGKSQYNEPTEALGLNTEMLLEMCRQYGDPNSFLWKYSQVVVPKFTNFGDMSILQNQLPGANPFWTFDPTPTFVKQLTDFQRHAVEPMSGRTKAWFMPSLLNENYWIERQKLTWDVVRCGPKGYTVYDSEQDVQTTYRQYVGAICTPYKTAGGGWWRSRWIHAALAGTVLLCDDRDAMAAGPEYLYYGSSYEDASLEQLEDAAEEQKQRMFQLLQFDEEVMTEQVYAPFGAFGLKRK